MSQDRAHSADEALAQLGAQLDDTIAGLTAARTRVGELATFRAEGKGWREIVSGESRPLVVESVTKALEDLGMVGGRFRREEAAALLAEGVSITAIGKLLGVSRQRASSYLHEREQLLDAEGDAPPHGRSR